MSNLIRGVVRTIILVLLAGVGWTKIYSQNEQNFINLSVNEGLSQSTIFSIHQDSKGFMWFGTRGGGLNKYNGYDFKAYMNKPEAEGSLSDNVVLAILEDSRGTLWVGTQNGGINRFDVNNDRFVSYNLQLDNDINQDQSQDVRCIYEDHSGHIWLGTNQRVYIYNKEEDRFDTALDEAPFPVKGTTSICEDKEGNLYFATWDRLIRYNRENERYDQLTFPVDPYADFGGRITPLLLDSDNRIWLGTPGGLRMVDINEGFSFKNDELKKVEWPASFNYVRVIKETRDGNLWFGTENGLYAYSVENNELREYQTKPNNPQSLCHNSVYSIFEDRVGALWVGTWSGLSILDKRKYNFKHYSHFHNDPHSLSNNLVSSFQEDVQGTWIGTEQGGLNFLNKDRNKFTVYKHIEGNPESLPSNNVKTVFLDSNGDLWVGTFNGGLSLHLGNGRFRHFLEGHSIYTIKEFPDGKLWVGGRKGLYVVDLAKQKISRNVLAPATGKKKIKSFVTVLFTDSKERVWIGTRYEGIYLYEPKRSVLKHFQPVENDTTSLSADYIITICEDPQQKIWIGSSRGLNRYNEANGSFERISQRIGISDNVINGLQPDDNGNIWISTNNGLYSYDMSSNGLRQFDYLDGLQSNEFNRNACYKNSKGELFFGGIKGFNVFHPENIKKNPDAPPVVITDLKLFNESVVPGEKNSPLDKHISETDKIVLTYHQSSFSFEFVALNYLIPEKNTYAYKLEGYDDKWNYSGRTRTASYMNLRPGNYVFHVKGSNNDKVWNDTGASVAVKVKAPIWANPYSVTIYIILLAALLYALIRIVRFRTEKENELLLERAEKDRIKEMNLNRLQFFTNISHEFRTPLTLIAGPLDKVMSGKHEHQRQYLLQLMKSNVDRMLRLVNQLMDFRKLENDKMPLRIREKAMDKFLAQIVLGFEDMANKKMIELKFSTESTQSDALRQWFDDGILDKVIYNLLSNAFKFTPEQGEIEVRLKLTEETARIEVSDTGKGIEQSKVSRIFERYYSDSPDLYASTGIGLSLSKRLIDLHKGTIEVESEIGKGANFIVTLPVSREAYSVEEIIDENEGFVMERPELDKIPTAVPLEEAYQRTGKNEQLVLIVEDNPEMSSYIASHLSEYKLMMAENGKLAFEMAKESIPDIIISDVMMPEMNGIEFCRAVKKEYLTSHIPVILLSAKAAIDEKIEGIEKAGADAYLEKPFDSEYLNAIIRNLLIQRKKLKDKYSGLIAEDIVEKDKIDKEEEFIRKVNEIVMANISDLSFSVDQLLVEVGMSRSQLYRKFKAISDKNPSEYIRILRLQHACKLLNKNGYTISEVAYLSGFGNVSYFNTCFKKHFGVSPGKYSSVETK